MFCLKIKIDINSDNKKTNTESTVSDDASRTVTASSNLKGQQIFSLVPSGIRTRDGWLFIQVWTYQCPKCLPPA